MDNVLLLARLVLAAVFGVAGFAKLADLAGSRQAMRNFGVPERLAALTGRALPLLELVVAVALLPLATARWGALGALALLLTFGAAIAYNLTRGRAPDCHCFGQLHSAPVGWPTLARTTVLALIAAFVVWQGWNDAGASAVAWIGELSASERVGLLATLLALGLVAGEGWLLLHLLRQNGRMLLRLEALESRLAGAGTVPTQPTLAQSGLPVGTTAPDFSLSGLLGETLTLGALRAAGKPVLLIFSDPNCGPCNALLPEIGAWQRDFPGRLMITLISRGTPSANRAKTAEYGVVQVLLQRDQEVADSYQARGTPSAVLVRPDGTVGSPLAVGAEAIRGLVTRTLEPPRPVPMVVNGGGNGAGLPNRPPTVPIGQPAPAVALPDLDGKMINLAEFIGDQTLVLFWNPGCGYCGRMLDDLKRWEAARTPEDPKLLVVSTGTVDANRAMDLRSPVVLDQGFAVGRTFGAAGTPSAVLVDAEGNIASDVAVGAPAVLTLAGLPRQ